jgi:hypothetical protein
VHTNGFHDRFSSSAGGQFREEADHLNKSDAIFEDRQSFALLESTRLQIVILGSHGFGNLENQGQRVFTRAKTATNSKRFSV